MDDEILEFCSRVLGIGPAADKAAAEALTSGATTRVELLAAARRACRRRTGGAASGSGFGADVLSGGVLEDRADDPAFTSGPVNGNDRGELAAAVARELTLATAALPERQREALALREVAGLSHAELSEVLGIDQAAGASLLARARLRLRDELRAVGRGGGGPAAGGGGPAAGSRTTSGGPLREQRPPVCDERERALRALARRQDGEAAAEEDEHWLSDHLDECPACSNAHAAMLEASLCYRAWT